MGDNFICDECEHKGLVFDETHTKLDTVVRVPGAVSEKEFTTEERLRLVEDKLAKMMGILEKLVEKSAEESHSGAFAEGLHTAAIGSGSLE